MKIIFNKSLSEIKKNDWDKLIPSNEYHSLKPGKSIDLYYSNAVGIQDIGQILEDKEYRIGFKLNFLY